MSARSAARSRWIGHTARVGLVAKGAFYAVIGLLAIQIPLGLGGQTADRTGAMREVAQQPLGEALLLALALGLGGYALWRFSQAFLDRDDEGHGPKGLAKRAASAARGGLYGFFAVAAFALVAGWGSGGGNEKKETALVLDLPLGRYLVAAIGLGFLGVGAYNGFRSLTGRFRKKLREEELGDAATPVVVLVGVAGHAARGVVFGMIGVFLAKAAWEYDPKEAIGIDGALRKLAQDEPWGELQLGLVAAGLLAYALWCFAEARYRDV